MPRNSVARMPDIQRRVIPALRLRGSRKALMPFEMASTPVRAVVPLEKACSRRNRLMPWSAPTWVIGGGSGTPARAPAARAGEPDQRP